MASREFHILLVEDNPGDIRLVREVMGDCGMNHRLDVVTDGAAALEYLRREKTRLNGSLPDLILMDLKLPKKDGREVLVEIKGDADLRRLPVVIFSSSEAEEDILSSYNQLANCYIRKPMELDGFIKVVGQICRFWTDTVKLPSKVAP